MADPRTEVDFEGIDAAYVTFKHDDTIVFSRTEEGGSAQVGLAVTVESANTVTLVGDGEQVMGKLISVEPDGKCVVQTRGGMTLPGGSSATLTAGSPIVGDLGASSAEGYIQTAPASSAGGVAARGTIVDPSTTTAVKVLL